MTCFLSQMIKSVIINDHIYSSTCGFRTIIIVVPRIPLSYLGSNQQLLQSLFLLSTQLLLYNPFTINFNTVCISMIAVWITCIIYLTDISTSDVLCWFETSIKISFPLSPKTRTFTIKSWWDNHHNATILSLRRGLLLFNGLLLVLIIRWRIGSITLMIFITIYLSTCYYSSLMVSILYTSLCQCGTTLMKGWWPLLL